MLLVVVVVCDLFLQKPLISNLTSMKWVQTLPTSEHACIQATVGSRWQRCGSSYLWEPSFFSSAHTSSVFDVCGQYLWHFMLWRFSTEKVSSFGWEALRLNMSLVPRNTICGHVYLPDLYGLTWLVALSVKLLSGTQHLASKAATSALRMNFLQAAFRKFVSVLNNEQILAVY